MGSNDRSESFFYSAVTTALAQEQMFVSEHTEFYLVGLLHSYAANRSLCAEPLGVKLMAPAPPAERTLTLKEVGDTALVVAGVFPESIEVLGVRYYAGLGRSAYKELAGRLSISALAEVYDDLSARFLAFVDLLSSAKATFRSL